MMKDSTPSLICCGDATLRDGIQQTWPDAPPHFLFDEIFAGVDGVALDRPQVRDDDPVTIIYTSGTSGEAKGVVLTAANVGFMLGCTSARLDSLMGGRSGQDRIFHYLPFSFCASWIAVLTFLLRGSLVTLNTDLTKIPSDMPAVAPHYFLNVPQLLERMRRGVDEQIAQKGGIAQAIYSRAKAAWTRQKERQSQAGDCRLALAGQYRCFSHDPQENGRRESEGPDLRFRAADSRDSGLLQHARHSVLQVYGLTETTGICTMDDPHQSCPGASGPRSQASR